MKSVLVLLLTLAVGAAGFYYLFMKYAKKPNQITQDTAKIIPVYPNAKTWQLKNSENFCFFAPGVCLQPVKIDFQTDDDWTSIFGYYRSELVKEGWRTNSLVMTSTPSSINFVNDDDCKLELVQTKPLLDFYKKTPNISYVFSIACPQSITTY